MYVLKAHLPFLYFIACLIHCILSISKSFNAVNAIFSCMLMVFTYSLPVIILSSNSTVCRPEIL